MINFHSGHFLFAVKVRRVVPQSHIPDYISKLPLGIEPVSVKSDTHQTSSLMVGTIYNLLLIPKCPVMVAFNKKMCLIQS